jgi:hypothetical protein
LVNASVHRQKIGGCADAFNFLLAFAIAVPSNERSKRVTAKRKKSRHVLTIFSLVGAVAFTLLLGGCADAYYANNGAYYANNGIRSPEARYNTYYAPDYYPYYPWDGYYGGAYYYGE